MQLKKQISVVNDTLESPNAALCGSETYIVCPKCQMWYHVTDVKTCDLFNVCLEKENVKCYGNKFSRHYLDS